jgi:hypothetical protein
MMENIRIALPDGHGGVVSGHHRRMRRSVLLRHNRFIPSS